MLIFTSKDFDDMCQNLAPYFKVNQFALVSFILTLLDFVTNGDWDEMSKILTDLNTQANKDFNTD